MREIRIRKEESGQRLDKFLRRYLPGAGSGFLYKMLRKKNILLDGKKAAGRELLEEGNLVRIYFSEETIRRFQESSAIRITDKKPVAALLSEDSVLYRDEQVLLISKPAGLLTQRADNCEDSLTELVRTWLLEKGLRKKEDRLLYEPGPANRLDRNTSGLVAVPLTLAAAQQLSAMFRARTIHKTYLALVVGVYTGPAVLTAWCTRDVRTGTTEVFFDERECADRIETHCEPILIHGDRTLLRVALITGKTHQIRSHLQACGYPIVGDPKYGHLPQNPEQPSPRREKTDANRQRAAAETSAPGQRSKTARIPAAVSAVQSTARSGLRRQFLHAWQLTFPICDGALTALSERTFTAPLPDDLKKELAACGMSIQVEYCGMKPHEK